MSGTSALSAPRAMSASRPRRRTGPARKPTSRTWRGRIADLLELGVVEVLGPIAQQKTRPCPGSRGAVVGVVEGASVERQTSAADAAVQQIAGLLEHLDPCLERTSDALADRLPILPCRRSALRQRRKLGLDFRERQPELLGNQRKRKTSDIRAHEAPLIAARADRPHETPRLIETNRRNGHARSLGELAD